MKGNKVFRDTVHGYISVPNEFCDKFVDTLNFQRLRRIEQLSSRSLYPCARHDRFVHSLGVFHIGCKIIETIKQDRVALNYNLSQSFLIACLLHDVGHSPFSHTLEGYFGTVTDLLNVYKSALTANGINDKALDSVEADKTDVKPHEIMSALLCVTTFREAIQALNADAALVGRMIMGFPYKEKKKSLENCFISLLHGNVIDADKLDYICRDELSSGYMNNSVDVERIIRSIKLYCDDDGTYRVVYHKNALYDIQSIIDNKNFQSNWVFKHHQVVYEQKIFKDAVEELVKSLGEDVKKEALFNYRSLFERVEVCQGVSVYMLSDDDIVHLMKTRHDVIPHFQEWMSHTYNYVPVWKTYSEMIAFLGEDVSEYVMKNLGNIYDEIETFIKDRYNINALSLESTPSMKGIKKGEVWLIYGDNKIIDYTTLGMPQADTTYIGRVFKYVFVEKKLFENTELTRQSLAADIAGYLKERYLKQD